MELGLLFGGMFLLIAIGVPIGFAIGGACIATMLIFPDISLLMIVQNCFTALNSFPLMAIPFFIQSRQPSSSSSARKTARSPSTHPH